MNERAAERLRIAADICAVNAPIAAVEGDFDQAALDLENADAYNAGAAALEVPL